MDSKQQLLDAMRAAGKPVAGGELATMTGLDRKVVDKAMADLKKDGTIVSPVRCKWQPA
jgi:biotin operon repressor